MSIGMPNINQYFKMAMNYPVAKLQAVMRGQDNSIPMVAAMAAYEIKSPMEIAAKAQQAAQKQSTVSIRDKLAQEGEEEKNGMLPDNAMMAMQQGQEASLPENTGIGQLPAPNMEGMGHANGGIIAFDDGGYVPGYAGEDGSLVRNNLMSSVPPPKSSFSRRITDKVNTLADEEGYQQELFKPIDTEKEIAKLQQQLNALPVGSPERGLIESRLNALLKRPKAPERPTTEPKASQDSAFGNNIIVSDKPGETVNSGIPQVLPKLDAAKRGAVGKASPADVPIAKSKTAPIASGIPTTTPADTEQQTFDVMSRMSGPQDAEIKSQYADLEKKTGEGIAALRRTREEGRPTGKAFEGLEKELGEEKAAVKGKEDKNLQMALVNAGLAIAGGTSRHAMENIGKGALVGTKQYMDGLEKLDAAAKERRKMTAMIDEARRAEARGDWKEKNDFETKAFDLGLSSRKASIDGLSKIYGENKKSATDIFSMLEAQKHADIRNKETNQAHLAATSMTAGASRENAAATREQNQMYREGTLRQQAQENARKLLDDKMNTFKLDKLTVTPQVYEQWRQFYLDQAFKDAGLKRGGGGGGDMFQGTKEDDALINKYRGR